MADTKRAQWAEKPPAAARRRFVFTIESVEAVQEITISCTSDDWEHLGRNQRLQLATKMLREHRSWEAWRIINVHEQSVPDFQTPHQTVPPAKPGQPPRKHS